jgi:PhnB protein
MNETLPAGMHALSPHLVCAGAAAAIDFYKAAFGATEMVRLAGPDGKLMHACLCVNGSSVMLVDEKTGILACSHPKRWAVRR